MWALFVYLCTMEPSFMFLISIDEASFPHVIHVIVASDFLFSERLKLVFFCSQNFRIFVQVYWTPWLHSYLLFIRDNMLRTKLLEMIYCSLHLDEISGRYEWRSIIYQKLCSKYYDIFSYIWTLWFSLKISLLFCIKSSQL